MPLALAGLSWLINGTWRAAAGDLMGCAVGHVGWFVRDVWTREMIGGPTFLSEAPEVLCVGFHAAMRVRADWRIGRERSGIYEHFGHRRCILVSYVYPVSRQDAVASFF
jgi:hypothetical protein